MSYDLFLLPRPSANMPRRPSVFRHLSDNRFQHQGNDIHYSNPDTGVYFHFTWVPGRRDPDEPNRIQRTHLAFNMNFFRPHTFALEADLFLSSLIQKFHFLVDDPQTDGMGQGEYSSAGFLRGWNSGNRFAVQVFQGLDSPASPLTLPQDHLRQIWFWNFYRDQTADHLLSQDNIDVYLPPIWFCLEQQRVRTFCLFPNLIPTALPRVDYVMIAREELSSPFKSKSKKTPAWVTWDQLRAVTPSFEIRSLHQSGNPLEYLLLFRQDWPTKDAPPRDLAQWIIGLPNWPSKPQMISPDQVLDAELFAPSPQPRSRKRK